MIHQILSGPLVRDSGLVTDDDVRVINSLHNPPPAPVAQRDVYVRRCRLAGDAVDAYFGCFRTSDLPKLLALVQGAPLLVGHNKRSLGVARFFGGEIVEHQGHRYLTPKFYWLRGHSSADDLRVAIDGGLYSEASLSFAYQTPTCSVCGKDVRTCEHLPGAPLPGGGGTVFYYYDEVAAVLEGSLVYRGAEPGTGFSLGRSFPHFGGGRTPALHVPKSEACHNQIIGGMEACYQDMLGVPTLRVKRHGKWYRAPLVHEEEVPEMQIAK